VLSKPSADSFAVGQRQKEATTGTIRLAIIPDRANGHLYSSNQDIYENEN
jgi:hypothetical protein